MTIGARLVLAAVLAVLAACAEPPRLPVLSPDATVVAFGDSLTFGSGATRGHDYPSVLHGLIGHEVVNAGVPGEVSAAGLRRLPAVLDRHHPQLLILAHGGNDMLRRFSRDQTRANLRAMIDFAVQRDIAVVLLGIPEPGLLLHSAELYEALAEQWHIPLEPDVLPDVLSERSLKSDTVHPNDEGYRRIAEAVSELLRSSGAL